MIQKRCFRCGKNIVGADSWAHPKICRLEDMVTLMQVILLAVVVVTKLPIDTVSLVAFLVLVLFTALVWVRCYLVKKTAELEYEEYGERDG